MNDKVIEELYKGETVIFEKGDYIARQGQPVDYIYYLSSGICMRNAITTKGDEINYDMRIADKSAYCLLGALTLYCPQVVHATNFVAKTSCVCYKIHRNEFMAFLMAYPEVLHELMYMAMDRYSSLDKNFHSKQKGCVANRVCSFIMDNLVEKDNTLWLDKRFTNSEISRYLGTHRVTIIKIIKTLENAGIIRRSSNGLQIINANQMLVYARNEETLDYHQRDRTNVKK